MSNLNVFIKKDLLKQLLEVVSYHHLSNKKTIYFKLNYFKIRLNIYDIWGITPEEIDSHLIMILGWEKTAVVLWTGWGLPG